MVLSLRVAATRGLHRIARVGLKQLCGRVAFGAGHIRNPAEARGPRADLGFEIRRRAAASPDRPFVHPAAFWTARGRLRGRSCLFWLSKEASWVKRSPHCRLRPVGHSGASTPMRCSIALMSAISPFCASIICRAISRVSASEPCSSSTSAISMADW